MHWEYYSRFKCVGILLFDALQIFLKAEAFGRIAGVHQTKLLVLDVKGTLLSRRRFRKAVSMLFLEEELLLTVKRHFSYGIQIRPYLLDAFAAPRKIVAISKVKFRLMNLDITRSSL